MKKLIAPVIAMILVSACSANKIKEEPKPAPAPAPVAEMPAPQTPQPAKPQPVAEKKVEVNPLTDPNNILSKRSVYFDFDNYEVKSEYRPLLEAHAKYLVEHQQANITLQGNADERGSREYNLALGQKRASSVKKVLSVMGVPNRQIETVSFGEEKPKALGHDESSWAENRRTDIVYQGEK